jgi:hypothetical protein
VPSFSSKERRSRERSGLKQNTRLTRGFTDRYVI